MAGKNVIDKLQLGNAGNALFNFLFSTLNNGIMKLQRGNDGGSLSDLMSFDASGVATFANTPGLRKFFESAEIAIAINTTQSVAHAIGFRPIRFELYLRCKTAELGYAVDDEILYPNVDAAGGNGITVSANATDLTVANLTNIRIHNKATRVATNITAARWRYVFRAYY